MARTIFGENIGYQCVCEQPIYFRNSSCLSCSKALAYDPLHFMVVSLTPLDNGVFAADQTGAKVRRCANLDKAGCNWLEPAESEHSLCLSCRLTRTIPDLTIEGNQSRWVAIELEKRRLIAQLLSLGLPIPSRTDFPETGLTFDLLGEDEKGNVPLTGHDSGQITLNIKEADDAYRAQVRESMGEPYRTLLGHFRHEFGHFYWDVLVKNSYWLQPFRAVFGDETYSYQEALDKHYQQGAPEDWQQNFISSYATMHPWEDWAESWAHYLHMMATISTAAAFDIHTAAAKGMDLVPYTAEVLYAPNDVEADEFLTLINTWIALTAILNILARSMGQPDTYPFAVPAKVVAKLQFIHIIVRDKGNPPALEQLEPDDAAEDVVSFGVD